MTNLRDSVRDIHEECEHALSNLDDFSRQQIEWLQESVRVTREQFTKRLVFGLHRPRHITHSEKPSESEDMESIASVQCLETLLKQKIAGHMKRQPIQPEEEEEEENDDNSDDGNDGNDDQVQAYISDGEDSDDVVMVSGNEHKHHHQQEQQHSTRGHSSAAIIDNSVPAMDVDSTVQLHQEIATPVNDKPSSTVSVDRADDKLSNRMQHEGSTTPTQSIIASEVVFDADDEATPKRRSSVGRQKVLKRRSSHSRRSRSLVAPHSISTDDPMLHKPISMIEERRHETNSTRSAPLLQSTPPTTFLQKDVLKIIERETGMPYHHASAASIPSTISSTDRTGSDLFSFDQRPQSSQSEHSSSTTSCSVTSSTGAQGSTDSVSTSTSTSVSSETAVPFASQASSENDKALARLSNSSTESSVSDVVSDIASSHRSSSTAASEDPVIEIHTTRVNVDQEEKRDPRPIDKVSDEQRATKQTGSTVKTGRGLTNMVSTAFSNITSNLRSFLPTSKPSERPAPATGAHKAKVKGTISSLRKAEMAKRLAQKREEERRNKRQDLRRRLEERKKRREEGESNKKIRASTITTSNTTSNNSSSSKQIVNSKKRKLMEKLEAHKKQNNSATPAQPQLSTAEPPRKKTKPSLPSASQVISKAQRLKSNLQLLKSAKTATASSSSSSSSSSRQMLPGQEHKQASSSPVIRTTPNRNPTTPIGKGAMLPPSQPYVSPMLKTAFQSPASTKSSPSNVSINSDNYPMTDDYYATSEEDELEEQRKGKRVPSWAKDKVVLNDYLRFTERMDPDLVFSPVKTIDLQDVFDNTHNKKRDLRKRTSSGNWARDHFTLAEEIQYKRDMGFKVTDIDLDDL